MSIISSLETLAARRTDTLKLKLHAMTRDEASLRVSTLTLNANVTFGANAVEIEDSARHPDAAHTFFFHLGQGIFVLEVSAAAVLNMQSVSKENAKWEKNAAALSCAGSFLVAEGRMKGRGWELFGAFKLSGARGIPKECVPNSSLKPTTTPPPPSLLPPSKPLCLCRVATEQELGHTLAFLYVPPVCPSLNTAL